MNSLTFRYRAFDRSGAEQRGTAEAASRAEAFRQLVAQGLTPIEVATQAPGKRSRGRRISSKDLAHFTYQLSVLMGARIPLSEGLLSIAQQEREGALKELTLDITRRIDAGEGVAAAMDAHRDQLGEVYVETVRAAERSGNLVLVLEHLSDMLERSQETRRQVRAALMYPTCVVIVLALAVFFLIGFVVPKFGAIFAKRGAELPALTKALLWLGQSFQGYWWAYALGAGVAAFGVRLVIMRPQGRVLIDRVLHRVPLVGDILSGVGVARFCRVLGLSISSGLSLIESLSLAGKASGRADLIADSDRMAAQVRTGGRLAEVLNSCKYLTRFTKRMLAAGEQSAEIPKMCSVVARHYDRETAAMAKSLSTVIEPVLVVAIAGVVLVVALAIFVPMWDMVKLVG